jgi:hypothetical protein
MKGAISIGLLAFSLCFTAGCGRRTAPTTAFQATIDSYYQAHPACIWMSEKTFPVKASAEDAKSAGYDALVDQGLLTRTAAGHRESTYSLSTDGQFFWVSDPNHSGAGNLCYGHRQVVSIDHASPTPNQPGYSTIVSYHYKVAGAPAWATAPEVQAAFPKLTAATTSQMAIATLTDTNNGWQLNPPPSDEVGPSPTSAANEPTSAGGKAEHKGAATD